MKQIRLPVRLFLSYAIVAVVGAVVAYVTVRLLAPHLFDQRIGMMNGNGMMGRGSGMTLHTAFRSALNSALVIGFLGSIAAAGLIAALVTRQLLRPLYAVRSATRRIAAGHYETSVPLPAEPELAGLASDVNTLAQALADTESRRVRLLGEVAHELRTPLTALDGYVEGMIDGVFPADETTLSRLSAELRRLHRFADDLSSLSRAEEDRLDLRPDDVDLADLAQRAAARLAPQYDDAHVRLIVDAGMSLPVHADPDRIVQVLTNLLGNALLASAHGEAVTITVRRVGDRGEVAVTDTGVGLAEEDVERVFERFYRAPGQARRSAGSGIGLTIARRIARGHGGDVTASSEGRGRGSTFVLALPLR